jgi:hypothetical protein
VEGRIELMAKKKAAKQAENKQIKDELTAIPLRE